jgi:hypothetical protein
VRVDGEVRFSGRMTYLLVGSDFDPLAAVNLPYSFRCLSLGRSFEGVMQAVSSIGWGHWSQFLVPAFFALVALWRWRADLKFEALRPYGFSRFAAGMLRLLAVGLLLVCLPLAAIATFKSDAPIASIVFATVFAGMFVIVIMSGILLPRDAFWKLDDEGRRTKIKLGRFTRVLLSPISASLAPIASVTFARLPEVLSAMGIAEFLNGLT